MHVEDLVIELVDFLVDNLLVGGIAHLAGLLVGFLIARHLYNRQINYLEGELRDVSNRMGNLIYDLRRKDEE